MPQPSSFQPAAVIFDMDGLMIDSETIYYASWQRAGAEMGYAMSDELFQSLAGLRTVDSAAPIQTFMGPGFPVAEFQACWDRCWDAHADEHGIDLKPGLVELIARVEALGLPKAVATSSERGAAQRCLRTTGLARHFDIVVTGDQVARGKPAPDIYREAARRLGADPAACIAFEDSSAGALAAVAAGMTAYIVPDIHLPTPEASRAAAAVLGSLHDALPLFAHMQEMR